MFFLLRCVFWLAIVLLAIGERGAAPVAVDSGERVPAAKSSGREAPPRSRGASAARGDALSGLADQAKAKLIGAARDQCLAHPMDCLETLEQVGRAAAWPEPPRR